MRWFGSIEPQRTEIDNKQVASGKVLMREATQDVALPDLILLAEQEQFSSSPPSCLR